MTTFQMAFIRRGPFWTDKMTPELEQLHQKHIDHLVKLGAAGQILTLGSVGEQGDLRGIIVLSVDHGSGWVCLPGDPTLVLCDSIAVVGAPVRVFERSTAS